MLKLIPGPVFLRLSGLHGRSVATARKPSGFLANQRRDLASPGSTQSQRLCAQSQLNCVPFEKCGFGVVRHLWGLENGERHTLYRSRSGSHRRGKRRRRQVLWSYRTGC